MRGRPVFRVKQRNGESRRASRGICIGSRMMASMVTIRLELQDSALSALRLAPHEFGAELCIAGAIHWYQQRQISMECAAEIARLDRASFLSELVKRHVDVFQVDLESLKREIEQAGPAIPSQP